MDSGHLQLLQEVIDELYNRNSCDCEKAPEGEFGDIECMPCRDNRLVRKIYRALGRHVDSRYDGRQDTPAAGTPVVKR